MKTLQFVGAMLACLLAANSSFGQSSKSTINAYLSSHRAEYGLTDEDALNYIIHDEFESKQSGINHVHIRQTHEGIELFNAVANFSFKDNKIIHVGNRLEKNIAAHVNTTQAVLTPMQAIDSAAQHFGITRNSRLKNLLPVSSKHFIFEGGDISLEDIPVKLMLFPTHNEDHDIRLVWDLSIYLTSQKHWWSVRVDAVTGEVLDQLDWVVECTFDGCDHLDHSTSSRRPIPENLIYAGPAPAPPPPGADQYRVYAIPIESPSHGASSIVVGPYDPVASPFGWHDTNGAAGAEFTYTSGNNVLAQEDQNGNNGNGARPDGGASLIFDFPVNLNNAPSTYVDASTTNLFYMNNIMHDVWYQYGFDEASGNFQENNYGNGGAGSDNVNADSQDGSGLNNANFGTPADGGNPRMQMFLWNAGPAYTLTINSPAGIAGQYQGVSATFGPGLPGAPLTADLALVDDNVGDPLDACEAIVNGASLAGKIAVIMRGGCNFDAKVLAAQTEGAVAVIVVNNAAGTPTAMGGAGAGVTIPSIMISDVDGALMIAQLQAPTTVNGTIQDATGAQIDGDLDNGIIAHEYGHGISNRLTGGPGNSGCLSNAEQMGEGWSDWFGLMLTIEPGDLSTDGRGIGTFAIAEPTTGGGIRPAQYSTNLAINNFTYDATNNTGAISQPHGIGFVWCTMIWDLSWAMIDTYGFDSDLYNGTGGNNMAMHLITEGLKLQPCGPGFVDGRDAILAADQALYAGANECLIWEVFAARGLGFSADQGNSTSRTDQVEAFDLPIQCLTPTAAPVADFSFTVDCNGDAVFTDLSTENPNAWAWDFGDLGTSSAQNPSHAYTTSGTYTATLIATNVIGSDAISYDVIVALPTAPVAADESICENQTATFTGTASGDIIWYDATGTIQLGTGPTYTTPVLTTSTTYQAENVIVSPSQYVDPLDPSFGTSGYHSGTDVVLNFTAAQSFTLISVWVDANSTGNRTINIWNAVDAGGAIIASTTVNITATGPQRIPINLLVPAAGTYSIGGTGMDLRRNNNGVSYPYSLAGVVDIISSSAGANFYYYYYDWEIQTAPCRSAQVPVDAIVNLADSTFETVSACDTYTWPANTTTYTSSGSYIEAFTNAAGCDSIKTLNLTIGTSTAGNETVNICNSYTWSANTTTYTSSGSYTATLTNAAGCDSVATLNLTIASPSAGSESVTQCNSYTWSANTTTYTSSGSYTATLTNAAGCDSVATLNLTIGTNNSGSEAVNTCNSFTWSANTTTYTLSGSYTATLTNAAGCDSVATLNLTILSPSAGSETVNICNSYTWSANTTTYTASGTYTATLTNAAGCDSIATLNLTIAPAVSGSESVTICNSYTWSANSTTYTASGAYTATLTAASGCDSIATLNLTIAPAVTGSEAVTICDSYTWSANSTTYTASGAYTATLTAASGCDSIATLNLTVSTSSAGSEAVTICDSYTWSANTTTYTASGTYTATLTNAAGCDSTATLNLTIGISNSGSEDITACVSYTWSANATNYTVSGAYTATLTNAAGCDSIATLNLTIASTVSGSESVDACDSYTWSANTTTYTTSGTYTATLIAVEGCDSLATLNLTITVVDNGVSPVGNTQLAANSISGQYQWIDCATGLPIVGATGQIFTPTVTGNYAVIVTENGCTDTSACTLITVLGLDDENFMSGLSVFPNPTMGEVNVHLGDTYEKVSIHVVDVTGKIVSEYFYPVANEIVLEINEAPGVYFIEIQVDNGSTKTVKVYRE
jgi:extracellular elastinolytic metalloproteinase